MLRNTPEQRARLATLSLLFNLVYLNEDKKDDVLAFIKDFL